MKPVFSTLDWLDEFGYRRWELSGLWTKG